MKTILKVQLSLVSTMDANLKRDRQVLIYDQERTFSVETVLSRFHGLEEAMNGRVRAFFEADVTTEHLDKPRTLVVFGKMLDEQGW
ncbi:MAG: hypothetical protein ACREJC_05910 [Tepidisphaeraceae bacterium]